MFLFDTEFPLCKYSVQLSFLRRSGHTIFRKFLLVDGNEIEEALEKQIHCH